MKFGLIGYGAWGSYHAAAINETEGVELAGIAVPSEASQNRARESFPNAFVTEDYRELIAREDIDAVDIVIPTHLHRVAGVEALEAGKHVLLEKPLAASLTDCRALLDAAVKNDRVLAVGHEFRLSSQWGEIKRIIDSGEIGEPKYVLIELSRKPYRLGADGWRYDIKRVGNWILEEPIHFFDLARWYLSSAGSPTEVFACANARDSGHPELQDNFSAFVRWNNGAYAVISQTLSAFEHHQTVKVTGTDGALWAGWSGALDRTDKSSFFVRVMRGHNTNPEELELNCPSGEVFELRWEIADFAQAVRTGKRPAATGEDGLWSAGLCLAAQQSVDRNQPIDLQAFFERNTNS